MSYEQPPGTESSRQPPPPPPEAVGGGGAWSPARDSDRAFVRAMRHAGLMRELGDAGPAELLARGAEWDEEDGPARRIDLLQAYYEADGDEHAALRRRAVDRYFVHRAGDPATARDLVDRLQRAAPEVGSVSLERIGDEDGPLVLRSAEHFAALVDPYDEALDAGEIDRSDIDSEGPTVSVSSLVRAINTLLGKHDVRERLVELRSDGEREAYVATGVAGATGLLEAGFLEDDEAEELMALTGW